MSQRVETIRQRLNEAFQTTLLHIHDDSLSHAGHRGTASGGGHFYATIVSEAFKGKTAVQRHRLVYLALGDMMQSDIHALGIKAFTPDEFKQQEI